MLDLQQLGFTKEELQQKVVDQICRQLMESVGYDEEGDPVPGHSAFSRQINDAVRTRIDTAVNALADKHILPNVTQYIENLTITATNKWGEKIKEPITFIEYLTERAEHYLTEQVNSDGKSKGEDTYNWSAKQTRITHLVHQHLHYSISRAMEEALKIANSAIATGIQETVKLKLAEISSGLQVAVKVKS